MKEFFQQERPYIVFLFGVLVADDCRTVHNIDTDRNKENSRKNTSNRHLDR